LCILLPRGLDVGPHLRRAVGGLTLLDGSRLEGLLARARLKPRIAEPDPLALAFACASAALVRSLISPASSSATAVMMAMTNLPDGTGGTCGRSQNTTPLPLPSTTDNRNAALRASRSSSHAAFSVP
jgi:hypothetical protein